LWKSACRAIQKAGGADIPVEDVWNCC